jgi:O-antigen ligase
VVVGLLAGAAALLPANAWWIAAGIAVVCAVPVAWHWISGSSAWLAPFLSALVLLPPVPFFAGTAGAHASVLIAAIGLAAGLTRAREWRLDRSLLNFALAAFTLGLIFSVGFALIHSGVEAAAGSSVRVILFAIAVYVFFSASQGPDRLSRARVHGIARMLFAVAVLGALFACLDFIVQLPAPAGFGAQFIWLDSGVYRRAQGLFYEASTLGNFCVFFLLMCAVSLATPRERSVLPRWAASAGVVLFAGTLILSFSRAAILAAVTGCLALALLERRIWAKRKVVVGLAVLAAAAVLLFWVVLPEFAAGYAQKLVASLAGILSDPERVLSGRVETWRTLGAFIADHPWQTVAGIGYKTLANTTFLGQPLIADNMYLSALIETGLLGLASLLLLNVAILRVSWQTSQADSFFGKWMFCFWAGEMVQMVSADVLTFWRVLPIYFWVLAQVAIHRRQLAYSAD